MGSISRRRALSPGAALGVGAAGAGTLLTTGTASAAPDSSGAQDGRPVAEEKRSLDELYRAAKAEGGKLVVYAGGDVASQQAGVVAAFKKQFPDIDLTMVVDYSKFHDARIDNQFATGQLIPDVTHLQTLQDFTRWKQQGRLLQKEYLPRTVRKRPRRARRDPAG